MFTTLICASLLLSADWGAGACGPVGSPREEWRRYASDPGRSYLFRDGVQAAGYDHETRIYRIYDARTGIWGPAQAPPWEARSVAPAPLAPHDAPLAAAANFGVDVDKLNDSGADSYRINGKPASRADVQAALADQRLPDDAGRLRLTVIGPEAARKQVTEDVQQSPHLAEWRERLAVQAYPPDHWAVAKTGFVTDGRPTIYLQTPDGHVIHRQDDYADGAEGLARALRRADPHYDPKKDPDLRRWLGRFQFDWSKVPIPVWILAAGAGYVLLRRRQSK